MERLDFIYRRRSVRSFTAATVSDADLQAILRAATWAPSGKNKQNWHFVVVKNREKIAALARLVERKNAELAALLPADRARSFRGMASYHTVFRQAPLLVLAYGGPYPTVADELDGCEEPLAREASAAVRAACTAVQNVAAAMENLLLAAAALGYGGCWMTGPTYAAEEINEALGFHKPGYRLVALTPLGVPAPGKQAQPPRKALADVVTVLAD